MSNTKQNRASGISDPFNKIADVPDAPTINTVTDVGTSQDYNNGAATVAFTGPAATGGATASYSVLSTPGAFTGTGTSSPITVTGLQSATAYTYQIAGVNSTGTGSYGTSSSAVTATTVPQAPTIGTFTDGGDGTTGTLSFTTGATGGSTITGYKVSTDGTTYTTVSGTTSPLSLTGLTAGTYNFYLKATNANGDSAASSGVSGTVIPRYFYSIATQTVGAGGASSTTFSSIPQGYTHLQIRGIAKTNDTTGSNWNALIQFNNNTATIYSYHGLRGTGASAVAFSGTSSNALFGIESIGSSGLPNSNYGFGVGVIDILDYSNTNKYKTIRTLTGTDSNGSGQAIIELTSGLWPSTSAINSITLFAGSPNFVQYSSFALYGIK